MPLFDDVRRWVKDRFTQDELIEGSPKEKLREVERALTQLSPTERTRTLEHAQAYATYYYEGHQRERVPADVRHELTRIEKQVERMNAVDAAREKLLKYGGAPTMHTIYESLERSEKEREGIKEALRRTDGERISLGGAIPESARESAKEHEASGYRMRI